MTITADNLPAMIVLAVAAAVGLWISYRLGRRAKPAPVPRCGCGYDLSGLVKCPECGR